MSHLLCEVVGERKRILLELVLLVSGFVSVDTVYLVWPQLTKYLLKSDTLLKEVTDVRI